MYGSEGSHSGTLMYCSEVSHSGTLMYGSEGSHSGMLMYCSEGLQCMGAILARLCEGSHSCIAVKGAILAR